MFPQNNTTSSEIVPSCVVDVVDTSTINPNPSNTTSHEQLATENRNVGALTLLEQKHTCNTRCSSLAIHLHSPNNAIKIINQTPHEVKESASENAGEAVIKATAVILRHSPRAQTTRWNAVEAVTRVHPYLLYHHGRVMGSAVLVALVIPSTVMCPNEDFAKSLSRTQII